MSYWNGTLVKTTFLCLFDCINSNILLTFGPSISLLKSLAPPPQTVSSSLVVFNTRQDAKSARCPTMNDVTVGVSTKRSGKKSTLQTSSSENSPPLRRSPRLNEKVLCFIRFFEKSAEYGFCSS